MRRCPSRSTNLELEDEHVLGPKPRLGASHHCRYGVAGSTERNDMPFFSKKSVIYVINLIYMNFPVGWEYFQLRSRVRI